MKLWRGKVDVGLNRGERTVYFKKNLIILNLLFKIKNARVKRNTKTFISNLNHSVKNRHYFKKV